MSLKMNYSVSSLTTQVNNGLRDNLQKVIVPFSNQNVIIVSLLVREGFIKSFTVLEEFYSNGISKYKGLPKTNRRIFNQRAKKKNMNLFFGEQVLKNRLRCVLLRKKKSTKKILVELKYFEGKSCVSSLKVMSKPSRTQFIGLSSLWKFYKTNFIFVLSTNKGILTSRKALQLGVGGKVLLKVF